MYLELRGRDGDSTVVITFGRWTHDFTLEVTWDAPSRRPAFESSASTPTTLSRIAAPFVDLDDRLYDYIVRQTGSHPGWGRVVDRPETVTLRGRTHSLQQSRYARGGVLLVVSEPYPARPIELTRWLPGLGLGPNQAAVRTGGPARGALRELVAAGVVHDTGRLAWSGRTLLHVVDVAPIPAFGSTFVAAVRHARDDYAEAP